jgi:5-methylthioribose kinase
MTANLLCGYLANLPDIAARLGSRQALWQVTEVPSSDLSAIFVVEGPSGDVCVKQALPATIDLDQEVILSLERTGIEEAALSLQARAAPGMVPRVLHYDSGMALMVMERLHPHVTLRERIIKGRTHPRLVEQITRFLARTLFSTSDLAMPATEKKERIADFCTHAELCRVTEYLAFTEPYAHALANRWTAPQLDDLAREIRMDDALKRAVSALKLSFMTAPQALIHGGLDTGSIMVTETDTKVIDPSRAIFGPIGFDLGTLLGHLLIGYFSQAGQAPADAPRTAFERWLLGVVQEVWQGFHDHFLGLWRSEHGGDAYPDVLFEGPDGQESLRIAQAEHMRSIFEDTIRFVGVTMIRHTLGRDHAADFAKIEDADRRAVCERHAIVLGRELLKDASHVSDIAEVADVARQIRAGAMDDD